MNNIKLEIQKLEWDIQSNLNELVHLKKNLTEKVSSIKMNIVLSEMLALGFFLGYIIIPGKSGTGKSTRFAITIILLKFRKFAKGAVSHLLGNQKIFK